MTNSKKYLFPTNKLQIINIDVWKHLLQISCMSNKFDVLFFQ